MRKTHKAATPYDNVRWLDKKLRRRRNRVTAIRPPGKEETWADVALYWHGLVDNGDVGTRLTRSQLREGLRKRHYEAQPGMISLLVRFGAALATLPPGERGLYRSKRLTLHVLRTFVLKERTAREILAGAQECIEHPSVDGRRARRRGGVAGGGAQVTSITFTYDVAKARADPVAYTEQFLEQLARVERLVVPRLRSTIAHAATRLHVSGASEAALYRSIRVVPGAMRTVASPADWPDDLRGADTRLAGLSAFVRARGGRSTAEQGGSVVPLEEAPVTAEELEEDLAE